MSIFNGLNINASGLALERLKLDTISTNIANVNTNQTVDSEAYRKKSIRFAENLKQVNGGVGVPTKQMSFGVRALQIEEDDTERLSYDPTNPAADENGYVVMSNVNVADEMVDMIEAYRTYEANASALEANKNILRKALEITKG